MSIRQFWFPFVFIGCFTFSLVGFAQVPSIPSTKDWGTWFIGTVTLPGGPNKWGGFVEGQRRTNALFKQYQYYELKGGVSYDLDKNITALVGGGHYVSYNYRDLDAGALATETRLWEQLVLNQYLHRLKFEHRYRVEQRWVNSFYLNRLRYRLGLFVPLNHTTLKPQTVFLSFYDEVFLNPKGPTFERNRVYGGVGYQFDQHWIAQAGWVNQTNFSAASYISSLFTPASAAGKNNLVLMLIYRIGRKTGPVNEKLPSQQD